MKNPLFNRLVIPLILLMTALLVPGAAANSIEDDQGNLWRVTSVRNDGHYQVRYDITTEANPSDFYWVNVPGLDCYDPFLFTNGTDVWVVWAQERTNFADTYDIYLCRIHAGGSVDLPADRVTKANDADITDREPVAAICPFGIHVAFRRETTTPDRLFKQIIYKNNMDETPGGGHPEIPWVEADEELLEIPVSNNGTQPTLLLGNGNDGAPTMVMFKEWRKLNGLGGDSKWKVSISIWYRNIEATSPGDGNPWERVMANLPNNPTVQ